MMDLFTALRRVRDGAMIRRLSWEDKDVYVDITDAILTIHNDSINNQPWIMSTPDFYATDWEIYRPDESKEDEDDIEEGEIA